MQTITSRENEQVKYACHLAASATFRAQEGVFFAEGIRLCADLAHGLELKALFATPKALMQCPEAEGFTQQLYEINDSVADKLSDVRTPQGLFGIFAMPDTGAEMLQLQKGVLLCEEMQNPLNLGAMMRSAAGFGLGGIALTQGCADPYGMKALRASMGAVGRMPVAHGLQLQEAVAEFKSAGATVYAATLENATALGDVKVQKPFVLMVGNEGAGLSQQAHSLADQRVYIPMSGGVESLNAAVAASVLMYEFAKDG